MKKGRKEGRRKTEKNCFLLFLKEVRKERKEGRKEGRREGRKVGREEVGRKAEQFFLLLFLKEGGNK